jgi:O-antigen ligase/polysaccharide polymerase Wzy-like membrane protein
MATAVNALTGRKLPALAPEFSVRRFATEFLFIALGLCALCVFLQITLALVIAVPLLTAWFWREPVRGVYVLVAGAVMIEIFPLSFPDSFTDRVPFFLNLNNSAGLTGLSVTPAEILMVTVALVAIARASAEGQLHWPGGRLVGAYCLYILVVLGAEIHGLVAGGDFKTSLWEIRPQVYGFILFFMATTLVVSRSQLQRLAIVFLLAVSVKAVLGDFRYFVTLQGNLGTQLEVLAHEDSYFLGMFVAAGLSALIWLKDRRIVIPIGVMSALALVAMLANSRRAGFYGLAGAVGVVVLLAYRFEPPLRKRLAWLSVGALIAGAIFVAYGWDKQYGIQAQLVRPIRALIDPTARDFSSDLYRTAETANLLVTFRTNPLIGVGFGHPFEIVYPMADISSIYPLWNVIPHNSVLWVGMRMGAIGFVAFWGLIGLAVLEGFYVLGRRRDPLVRALAAFAIAAIVSEIAVGYVDLQLESYRNLIFLGVVIGILNRLPQLPEAEHA